MDFREIKWRRWIRWYFPSNGECFNSLQIDEKKDLKNKLKFVKNQ